MTRVRRDSARVIVIDRAGRVLLLSGDDPHTPDGPFWLTPGGGTEPGESLLDTAVRELREETGFVCAPGDLGEPVAVSEGEWEWRGTPMRSRNTHFALIVDAFEPIPAYHDVIESEILNGHRWWTPEELDNTDEEVVPKGLADLVRAVVAGGVLTPVELPW
jgi:8-oxo-dGTP pyrophosphatase MutT (NUDIX family)